MVRYARTVSENEARLVSYAQNAEDVLIDRVFQKSSGFFIDVGAFHPIVDSVTKHFSLLGWTGINIEPDREFFATIESDRPNDINLCVAVGNRTGEVMLHRISARQCSTISEAQFALFDDATRAASSDVAVPLRTLADICAEHVRGDIDFLKIDVEGAERDVIEGADWQRYRPRLLVVEAIEPVSAAPNWMGWEPLLLAQGYLFQHFDGINRYYLREEDRALASQLSAPINYLDWYFSFGDLLHVQRLLGDRQSA